MTTIVWDGEYLIADSMVTQGDVKGSMQKIYKVDTPVGKRLIGFAGSVGIMQDVIEMVEKGLDPTQLVGEDSAVVIVSKDYAVCISDKENWKQQPPVILGTGRMAVLTALELGCSTEEAVKVACKIDLHSLGPIKKLKL